MSVYWQADKTQPEHGRSGLLYGVWWHSSSDGEQNSVSTEHCYCMAAKYKETGTDDHHMRWLDRVQWLMYDEADVTGHTHTTRRTVLAPFHPSRHATIIPTTHRMTETAHPFNSVRSARRRTSTTHVL